jgi:ribonuclease BN (tRNA processing enzyme)
MMGFLFAVSKLHMTVNEAARIATHGGFLRAVPRHISTRYEEENLFAWKVTPGALDWLLDQKRVLFKIVAEEVWILGIIHRKQFCEAIKKRI